MSAIRAYVLCVLSCFACLHVPCVPPKFACLECLRALRAYVLTCLRALRAYVLCVSTCLACPKNLHAYVLCVPQKRNFLKEMSEARIILTQTNLI